MLPAVWIDQKAAIRYISILHMHLLVGLGGHFTNSRKEQFSAKNYHQGGTFYLFLYFTKISNEHLTNENWNAHKINFFPVILLNGVQPATTWKDSLKDNG